MVRGHRGRHSPPVPLCCYRSAQRRSHMLALPMSTQTALRAMFSMMASAWIYNNAVINYDNS